MSLLFHQSVNMEQVISIGNYKKVGREPYFFNPQTNNLEGQFFLSAAPYRRLLQNVRCRLRRRCLYGEALGLQKPKPDCYYHQDSIAYNTLLHRHRRCQHLQLKALRLFLHMLLVLILMATGILLSHTAITSGGGTASIYGMYCVILWRGRTSYVPFPKIGSIGFI